MKLLLLGRNGQVGRELRRSLAPLGELVVATRDGKDADVAADFDAPASLAAVIAQVAPDVVVNAAAYTAVDKAEGDIEAAFRANAEAPAVLAHACASSGTYLVHYSTDYVFDGRGRRPCLPDDPTAPLGVYGASKLAGDEAVCRALSRHLILRVSWVFGRHGHNFVKTILRLAREREELAHVGHDVLA